MGSELAPFGGGGLRGDGEPTVRKLGESWRVAAAWHWLLVWLSMPLAREWGNRNYQIGILVAASRDVPQ